MIDQAQVSGRIQAAISIKREDIARAKQFVMTQGNTHTLAVVDQWVREQKVPVLSTINFLADDAQQQVETVAREYSLRFALFRAVWELITSGDLAPASAPDNWKPRLPFNAAKTGYSNSNSGPLSLENISFPYMPQFHPLRKDVPGDTDIFFNGIDCRSLHSGIRAAIEQSLTCFQRGLYMPSVAMLAAASEATWTECGIKVARKLSNIKLENLMDDSNTSIAKKVSEIREALKSSDGKALLKTADRGIGDVTSAENWTTEIRERRNALHWDKAKSFIIDHSEAGTLLMGAPRHIGTLEAIRGQC